MTTAKHRAIDALPPAAPVHRQKLEVLGRATPWRRTTRSRPRWTTRSTTYIGDDLLRLIFTACHPVLSTEARVALTLRLLGGLTTEEIARAFLIPEATVGAADRAGQADARRRSGVAVRAAAAGGAGASGWRRCSRSSTSIFNEGYAATAGDDWMRPALCEEALRLGRLLAGLVPARARGARAGGADGDPGVADRRRGTGPDGAAGPAAGPGPAAVGPAADPARARGAGPGRGAAGADRPVHAAGRDRGLPRPGGPGRGHRLGADRRAVRGARPRLRPSPVVELNRAVAVGMAARAGGRAGDRRRAGRGRTLPRTRSCRRSAATCSPGWAAATEARAEFERAAGLTRNARERSLFLRRAGEL